MLVNDGDWVKIGGRLLRVAHLNRERGTATTERLDRNGHLRSTQPTKIAGLQPCAADDPTAEPWPDPPPHLTDALDRARFYRISHERHLEAAGLVDDGVLEFEPD